MRDALCMLFFFAIVACGGGALVSVLGSVAETAPGTSTWTALTRGAFLGRKHFTERGWALRKRALWLQLTAMGLMLVFFLTCAEF